MSQQSLNDRVTVLEVKMEVIRKLLEGLGHALAAPDLTKMFPSDPNAWQTRPGLSPSLPPELVRLDTVLYTLSQHIGEIGSTLASPNLLVAPPPPGKPRCPPWC